MSEINLLSNRYELEKPLDNGGMAVVYKAYDLTLKRAVAIKVLREDYSRDPEFRERFRQEATAVANLTHPNIVTVHDFGIDNGQLFLVMEYVPGTSMQADLQKRGRYTVEEALPLILQICAGVGYAHRVGLVHCDLKPHNFLITPDNRLKVADFGIARAMASTNPVEKTKVVWGSPLYFSPEQAAGEPPTFASDVYSIGVVMYYMLTGRLPFTATTPTELAQLHRTAPPPPPSQFNSSIPPELEQIILKVLSKEPSARYRTAGQLERVLITISGQEAPLTSEPTQAILQDTVVTQPQLVPPSVEPARKAPSLPVEKRPLPAKKPEIKPVVEIQPGYNPFDIDWISLILGLVALIAVGGLVPFWLWVYLIYNPPGR